MQCGRGGQLERRPSASGVPPSRGGASAASEHGVAACHLRGELERPAHGLPFTVRLGHILYVGKHGENEHPNQNISAINPAYPDNFVFFLVLEE